MQWIRAQPKRYVGALLRRLARASTAGLETGDHVTRFWYYQHLSKFRVHSQPEAKVLAVSGSERLAQIFGYADEQIVTVDYPEYDLLSLNLPDNEFDGLFADQVLEHVSGDPFQAFSESFRVVKSGGLVVYATVFIYPIHDCPVDCWRFSPMGLRLLAAQHGDVVDAGGWGNFWVWPYFRLGLLLTPIPYARWHPLHKLATHNSAEWPIVTWVVARKR